MSRKIFCLLIIVLVPFSTILAQITPNYYWTAMDQQPSWVKSIDLAYGKGGVMNQAWHRYLIGSDENSPLLYFASEGDPIWANRPSPNENVNRIISYKGDNGNIAFCTSYQDKVYRTLLGGNTWLSVPGSDNLSNKSFKTIEVDPLNAGGHIYVGCKALEDEPSVFEGVSTDGGQSWDWDPIGNGLSGKTVNDVEYRPGVNWMACATDDGIYRYGGNQNPPQWERMLLQGSNVVCLEALDHEGEFWAATGGSGTDQKLYYTWNAWDNYQEIQVESPAVSFDKAVNDIAAIYFYDGQSSVYQSVYIATETGLYLMNISGTKTPVDVLEYVNFQDRKCRFITPFNSDTHIRAIDYYQKSPKSNERDILVGTDSSVFVLKETRDTLNKYIISIDCQDISNGTFNRYPNKPPKNNN